MVVPPLPLLEQAAAAAAQHPALPCLTKPAHSQAVFPHGCVLQAALRARPGGSSPRGRTVRQQQQRRRRRQQGRRQDAVPALPLAGGASPRGPPARAAGGGGDGAAAAGVARASAGPGLAATSGRGGAGVTPCACSPSLRCTVLCPCNLGVTPTNFMQLLYGLLYSSGRSTKPAEGREKRRAALLPPPLLLSAAGLVRRRRRRRPAAAPPARGPAGRPPGRRRSWPAWSLLWSRCPTRPKRRWASPAKSG